jgi:hypothetical protein
MRPDAMRSIVTPPYTCGSNAFAALGGFSSEGAFIAVSLYHTFADGIDAAVGALLQI